MFISKRLLEPATSHTRDRDVASKMENLQIVPNSCFNDFRFPEFTEFLFHLGKTPLFQKVFT